MFPIRHFWVSNNTTFEQDSRGLPGFFFLLKVAGQPGLTSGTGPMSIQFTLSCYRIIEVKRGRPHRSGGYGLGLAVVKFIVEAHKGEIRVESELTKGSIFTFYIPDDHFKKFFPEIPKRN